MWFFSDDIKPLIPLYIAMLIEAVGSGLIASVLNVIARQDLGCTNLEIGIIWSCYNAALILGSVIMGHFADLVRRKYVLMVTLSWVGCGYILTGFADSFEWLLASRIVTGLCGGSFSIAASILTANFSSEVLPMAIGRLATAASAGFAIGSLLSSALTAIWGIDGSSPFYIQRLYFFVAAGVYAIAALAASRLNASLTCPSRMNTQRKLKEGHITRGLCFIWSSRFFSTCAVTAIYITQSSIWTDYMNFSRVEISLLTTASGLAVSIVQGYVFPKVVGRVGFHLSLLSGIGLIALACAVIGPVTVLYKSLPLHLVCLGIFWIGVAFMEPGTVVAVSRHLKQSAVTLRANVKKRMELHTGLAMGVTSAMKYTASLAIPPLAGKLYDNHRELVYYVSSGIALFGVVVVIAAWCIFDKINASVTHLEKEAPAADPEGSESITNCSTDAYPSKSV
jgi:MFS family permease